MKDLKQVYNILKLDKSNTFTIKSGENARGFRINLSDIKRFDIKNYIKIDEKIYETEVENITDNTADVTFPALKEGNYKGELVVSQDSEVLKSSTYSINVLESIFKGESDLLTEVDINEVVMDKIIDLFNDNISKFKGEPGEVGPQGPKGDKGEPGTVDLSKVENLISEKLKGISINSNGSSGFTKDEIENIVRNTEFRSYQQNVEPLQQIINAIRYENQMIINAQNEMAPRALLDFVLKKQNEKIQALEERIKKLENK